MSLWPCQSTSARERAAATSGAHPSALVVAARSASGSPLGSMIDQLLVERAADGYRAQRMQAAALFGMHARLIEDMACAASEAVAAGGDAAAVASAVMEAGCLDAVYERARAAAMDAHFAETAWSFDRAVEKGDL